MSVYFYNYSYILFFFIAGAGRKKQSSRKRKVRDPIGLQKHTMLQECLRDCHYNDQSQVTLYVDMYRSYQWFNIVKIQYLFKFVLRQPWEASTQWHLLQRQ